MADGITIDKNWSPQLDPQGLFAETFANAYQAALQNKGGHLSGICPMETLNGADRHTFFIDGKTSGAKRHVPRKPLDISATSRRSVKVVLEDFEDSDCFDYLSEIPKMSADLSRNMAMNVANSMARRKDIIKLNAMMDWEAGGKAKALTSAKHFKVATKEGEPIGTPVFTPSTGKVSFSSSGAGSVNTANRSGLNWNTLVNAKTILRKRNAGTEGGLICVASVKQYNSLMKDEHFINADYGTKQRFESGDLTNWQGIEFIWLTDYDETLIDYSSDKGAPTVAAAGTGAGTYDVVMLFDKMYLGAVMGKEYASMYRSDNPTLVTAYGYISMGAVVKDWDRGLFILCDQNAGPKNA